MQRAAQEIVLATHNPGKVREMRALLEPLGLRLVPAAELGLAPVAETGQTLADNARRKAIEVARQSGRAAIADDTGLEVDALGGAPGVHSARWAGEGSSAEDNNRRLLEQLAEVPATERTARFRTVIAWAAAPREGAGPEIVGLFEGVLEGTIASAPRGEGGFGYDPLFVPRGERRTLAEMSTEEKNAISHRARALAALRRAVATAATT